MDRERRGRRGGGVRGGEYGGGWIARQGEEERETQREERVFVRVLIANSLIVLVRI